MNIYPFSRCLLIFCLPIRILIYNFRHDTSITWSFCYSCSGSWVRLDRSPRLRLDRYRRCIRTCNSEIVILMKPYLHNQAGFVTAVCFTFSAYRRTPNLTSRTPTPNPNPSPPSPYLSPFRTPDPNPSRTPTLPSPVPQMMIALSISSPKTWLMRRCIMARLIALCLRRIPDLGKSRMLMLMKWEASEKVKLQVLRKAEYGCADLSVAANWKPRACDFGMNELSSSRK